MQYKEKRPFIYGYRHEEQIPDWCKELPEVTKEIMELVYAGRIREAAGFFAPNLIWIGAMEWQFIEGAETMLEMLSAEKGILREVADSEYGVIYADEHCCTVAGRLHARTTGASEMVLASLQRATFQYALFEDGPKAVHIHVSNSFDLTEPGELFPFRAGRETYRYMQEILRKEKKKHKKITVRDIRYNTHIVLADEILFIEAQKPHCILHGVEDTIEVYAKLGELHQKLPVHFVRSHRSFLVNAHYVIGVRRFALHLYGGHVLPIPVKRYTEVREQICKRAIGNVKKVVRDEDLV